MKIILNKGNVASLFFENNFYDCGVELDVSFTEALKLSRIANVDVTFSKEEYNPELFKAKRFGFAADVDTVTGYGNVSFNLLKYSRDYQVSQLGKLINIDDPTLIRMNHTQLDPGMAMIWHDQPRANWKQSPFAKNIAITPFETTLIPKTWIPIINQFDALFVPCKQNIEAYRNSGLTVPIELIHWGVDPNKFYPLERNNEYFTFGTMGALSLRKGTDVLVQAFRLAFPTERDVRLYAKTSYHYYPFMVRDPRIIVEQTPWTHEELIENFFKKVDCFVFPTRGEGFGLTPLEAMATGIPAIATGWSGIVEYLNNDLGWLLNYKLVPATNFNEKVYKEDCGEWADPSLEHLVEIMREAYRNRDLVKQKGKAAAEAVQKEWLWENKIKMFHEALGKHL